MQFSDQVLWSPFDFLVMAILLVGFGWLGEWGWRKVGNRTVRILLVSLLVLLFLLIWAELAVGVFGSPLAGS
jgi:uncharacterized membrane protein YfcA